MTLTPARGYDKDFAAGIQQTESVIQSLVRPADLAESLVKLLVGPDSEIQSQACLALARRFRFRDPCLPALLESSELPIRRQAEIWMQGRRESTGELIAALRDRPLSLSVSGRVEDFADELNLFTLDWDPGVRRQACETLGHLFPLGKFPRCGAIVGR